MEKLRISLSQRTFATLCHDMAVFSIYKETGEINRNEFINKLIINYADEFIYENNKLIESANKILDKKVLDNVDKNKISNDIIKTIRESLSDDSESVIISLKPTKASESIIDYVINEVAQYQSNASFFRLMFEQYASYPIIKREQIIFHESYEALNKAIEKNRKVFVKLRNRNKDSFTGSIYYMGITKDERSNYCLFEVDKQRVTVKLSKIEMVRILKEPASFEKRNIQLMEFQKEYCLEHQITRKDFDAVKVFLTEEGKKMYDKESLNRPTYTEEEEGYYYFMGNHEQIMNYFKSFGKNALIIEPLSLRKKMEEYYKETIKAYSKK